MTAPPRTTGAAAFAGAAPSAGVSSRSGIAMDLMVSAVSGAAGPRKAGGEVTRLKTWRPPSDNGLCAIGRGLADHGPGGDDLLVWYRSHGRERRREVSLWLAYRFIAKGWDCRADDAARIIGGAMDRVRAGRRRLQQPRPFDIGQTRHEQMLSALSAWLRAGLMDAEYRYWQTQAPAVEIPAARHTGDRGQRGIHYPTRPNCFLRKARPEAPIPFDQAA